LLLDPYARALDRTPRWHNSMIGYRSAAIDAAPRLDLRNSAPAMPKCVVVDSAYDWDGDRKPAIPWEDLVIYEAHVKGMTALHPEVPRRIRGKFAGLASPAIIGHLTSLGVNAVELMPVHQTAPEHRLFKTGLSNYWGYNTIGYFAPDIRFASGGAPGSCVTEFKAMVKALHGAGIEVILDVVYNHSGEGDARGRIPLRPCDHTCARTARRFLGQRPVFCGDCAGPGDIEGQVDRGAVGRRRGRLPGRRFSGQLEGMERQIPRQRPRFLARCGLFDGRVCIARHRQFGSVPRRRPRPARQHQLCHRARRL